MSLVEKEGSAAVRCDCLTCHAEVLARTPERAKKTAIEDGWKAEENGSHLCPDCQIGRCPGEAAAIGRFGTSRATVLVPEAVRAGDEIKDFDGRVLGVFANDAKAGEAAEIDFVVPVGTKDRNSKSCFAGRIVRSTNEDSGKASGEWN